MQAILDYSDTITGGDRPTDAVWTPRQTKLTWLYNNNGIHDVLYYAGVTLHVNTFLTR